MKAFLAVITVALLTAGCAYRTDISRDISNAVSELDRSIWADGLKPIVPAADKPMATPPLK